MNTDQKVSMTSPVINLADVEVQDGRTANGDQAEQYDLRRAEIASRVGARELGYNMKIVAPGKRSCPFHSHRVEEEMFFILEGYGELRYGDTRHPLRSGDLIACPPGGPETAHQIINTGDTEMRYLAVSTRARVEICDYPDSGKVGFYLDRVDGDPSKQIRHLARREDSRDYWEGE